MKRIAAFALCGLTACLAESQPYTAPVDMVFRVSVESLENTCDDKQIPAGAMALFDVYRRTNGNADFRNGSGLIPGLGLYENIKIEDGMVDFEYELSAEGSSDKNFMHAFKGTVTWEALNLTLSVDSQRLVGDETWVDCVRRVRLSGAPRGFLDATRVDGMYSLTVVTHESSCPPGQMTPETGRRNSVADFDEYAPGHVGTAIGSLLMDIPLPGEDGVLQWKGTGLFFVQHLGALDADITLTGTLRPDNVELTMRVQTLLTPGCEWVSDLRGAKRIPSKEAVDNEYRVAYTLQDDCTQTTERIEATTQLVTQTDGTISLMDPYTSLSLIRSGDELWNNTGSTDQGWFLDLNGKIKPPWLEYSIDYHQRDNATGAWCRKSLTAGGVVRYAH
jgi:hypothetical protein